MPRKYTRISIDIEFDEIADDISTQDLISELDSRDLTEEEQLKLKRLLLAKTPIKELEELKLSDLNLIQEMKVRHFLSIMDKYSIEQIETLLP